MNNSYATKQYGLSLIETMIAAFLVAVSLLGLARLQTVTLVSSTESKTKVQALNLAQDKIEELRAFSNYNTYTGFSGTSVNTDAGANTTFTRTWVVSGCANSVSCKQVNVSVSWTDSQGATKTVQLTSYIAGVDPVQNGLVLLAVGATTSSTSSTSTSSTSSTSTSTTMATTSSTLAPTTTTTALATTTTALATTTTVIPVTTTTVTTTTTTTVAPVTYSCIRKFKNSGGWVQSGYPLSTPAGGTACCTVAKFQAAWPSPANNQNYTVYGVTCP